MSFEEIKLNYRHDMLAAFLPSATNVLADDLVSVAERMDALEQGGYSSSTYSNHDDCRWNSYESKMITDWIANNQDTFLYRGEVNAVDLLSGVFNHGTQLQKIDDPDAVPASAVIDRWSATAKRVAETTPQDDIITPPETATDAGKMMTYSAVLTNYDITTPEEKSDLRGIAARYFPTTLEVSAPEGARVTLVRYGGNSKPLATADVGTSGDVTLDITKITDCENLGSLMVVVTHDEDGAGTAHNAEVIGSAWFKDYTRYDERKKLELAV